jgi:signal transduction histidine kinase
LKHLLKLDMQDARSSVFDIESTMHRIAFICLTTLLAGSLAAVTRSTQTLPEDLSTTQLEQRLETIEYELYQLAHFNPRSGTGSIGYRSPPHSTADELEWVQVELEQTTLIDQIVLVPAIWRDTENGFQEDGFPIEFRILAGTDANTAGTVIASFSEKDQLLPRIAPLVVACDTTASWVRVEATKLSARQFDGEFNLELAELLIFSGEENVAIHRPITLSSADSHPDPVALPGRKKEFLVDGFMPYQMDTGQGDKTVAFFNSTRPSNTPTITIDLQQVLPLSRLHLHTVEQSDTAPQSTASGLGLPEHFIVEGAQRADFSDAVRLMEYRKASIYDVGPILVHAFPETPCRYVRLTVLEPDLLHGDPRLRARVGFAEIELFSVGENVALGKPVTTKLLTTNRPNSLLTDGSNFYGRILTTREWMTQLARRHQLEVERPPIAAELSHRYSQQKTMLQRMIWLATLLLVGIGFILVINRSLRQRAIHRIREQIAADLHDELGANLHAIGLLSDFVRREKENPEQLEKLMQRMRSLTERTAAATKYCTNMLESEGLYDDLAEDMRRTATRITADHQHDLSFEGEARLQDISPRRRIDLFLFYKECLTNIIRHAEATQITTHLIAGETKVTLTITDNGHGLNGEVPASLKRRARLLKSTLTTEGLASGGTRVTLQFKTRYAHKRKS